MSFGKRISVHDDRAVVLSDSLPLQLLGIAFKRRNALFHEQDVLCCQHFTKPEGFKKQAVFRCCIDEGLGEAFVFDMSAKVRNQLRQQLFGAFFFTDHHILDDIGIARSSSNQGLLVKNADGIGYFFTDG